MVFHTFVFFLIFLSLFYFVHERITKDIIMSNTLCVLPNLVRVYYNYSGIQDLY